MECNSRCNTCKHRKERLGKADRCALLNEKIGYYIVEDDEKLVYECPRCSYYQLGRFRVCPKCKVRIKEWKQA